MRSHASADFWRLFKELPAEIQRQAKRAYRLWREDSAHPSLHFKRIHGSDPPLYSVRIGLHWRALAARQGDDLVWFWIGSHADYDRLVAVQ